MPSSASNSHSPPTGAVITLLGIYAALGICLAGPSPGPIFPTEDATPTSTSEVSELPDFDVNIGSNVIQFHIFSRSNPTSSFVVTSDASWNNSALPFDLSLDVTVLIHGFTGSVLSKSVTLIRNALLFKLNVTVVAVQWAHLAQGPWYDEAARNTLVVAKHLATFLRHLEKFGLSLDRVHIVGFSLGAHVAGLCGAILEGQIGRISGLDPARPGFDSLDSSGRLDETDAKFVMGLHTGAGFVALLSPVGHADFYPNGGSQQPHCDTDDAPLVCNHFMAYTYFAESIYDSKAFPSYLCPSWEDFDLGKCDSNQVVDMGYYTPNNTRGVFYLKTNGQEPYGSNQENHLMELDVNQTESKPDSKPHKDEDFGGRLDIPGDSENHNRNQYSIDNSSETFSSFEVESIKNSQSSAALSRNHLYFSGLVVLVPISFIFQL